jgi:hypothetical protein
VEYCAQAFVAETGALGIDVARVLIEGISGIFNVPLLRT